jgi:hypothetical protein
MLTPRYLGMENGKRVVEEYENVWLEVEETT